MGNPLGMFWATVIVVMCGILAESSPQIQIDNNANQHEPTELKLLHVVFRHGDRTPDREEMDLYPDDPNIDNNFEPFGLKALTNEGKLRTYQVGVMLRERYKNFLNKLYIPDEITVRTTNYDRTKMSALACLAGLYPPEETQRWHKDILWQPIPYFTISHEKDDLMYYYTCPRFLEARTEAIHSEKFQKILASYKDLFEKLSFYTGRNITTPEDVFYLDNLFQTEANYNLSAPEWAVPLMNKIQEMTVIEYAIEFHTDELSKISGGTLLNKMLQDSYAKIRGTVKPERRKLFLYSAHENNVAAILSCSRVFKPHQPQYASTYILELHETLYSKVPVFRVVYYRDPKDEPEVLPIPGCGEFCPYDRFVQLTKNVTTTNWQKDCKAKHPN